MSTRRYDTPVPHDHTVRTAGCFRCELSADEVAEPAPAVDGWVWCYSPKRNPAYGMTNSYRCVNAATYEVGGCPGPHRTLILGPEVER